MASVVAGVGWHIVGGHGRIHLWTHCGKPGIRGYILR